MKSVNAFATLTRHSVVVGLVAFGALSSTACERHVVVSPDAVESHNQRDWTIQSPPASNGVPVPSTTPLAPSVVR